MSANLELPGNCPVPWDYPARYKPGRSPKYLNLFEFLAIVVLVVLIIGKQAQFLQNIFGTY
jgi:hypothetical protein